MKKLALAVPFLFLAGLTAQTVETIPYRAILSNANEVPPPSVVSSGTATVLLHLVRDSAGKVISGSVDANVNYKFPGAVTITAMHIHNAPAGTNGSIVIPFAITRTDDATGVGTIPAIQTQFPATAVTLDTINALLADPSQFYFNVHSTDFPGGAMRAQLQRAEQIVRMGLMSPSNETPPIVGQNVSGVASIVSYITRNPAGRPTSALVIFDVNYTGFADDTTFTGLHIHLGLAGIAGPVNINTGIRSVPGAVGGAGNLHYEVEADVSSQAVVDTLNALQYNPAACYVNAHTSVYPGGVIRSQLLSTDKTEFQVTLSPANEVPAVAIVASAPAKFTAYSVRKADGSVAAGTVIFDVNPRFPAGTTFAAMHIHDQVAGQNGSVTIDSFLSGSPLLVADGTGNIYRIAQTKTAQSILSLNDVLSNPDKHYLNLHTTANPGGAVRSQLMPASADVPAVTFVETGAQDPFFTNVAPGGLALIAGANLAKVGADLTGFNFPESYPTSLNGTQVTIGGKSAPIYLLTKDRVFVQVPFETAAGKQPVVVTTANGPSAAFNANVTASAPMIFFYDTGAVALKSTDFSVVNQANPVKVGDSVIILATGLGQTTPAQTTGKVTTDSSFTLSGVTVQLGGQSVPATTSSIPGLVGVYGVTIKIPAGTAPGNVSVSLQAGGVTSNISSIAVQ